MPRRRYPSSAATALIAFFVLLSQVQTGLAAVLAIDYGSEWITASLMKPGVPFDVLLNRDSKRKTQTVVSWKNDDRLFGSDAFSVAARFPRDTFTYLKPLQGITFDSDAVSFHQAISSNDIFPTSRNTVGFRRTDGTEWSVEELIAMQFSHIKELAETVAGPGESVKDAVIIVPPYFTQFERDAVVDALEIAGMKLVAMINDGTAVALNYALARTFKEEKEWHVIFDAGASSTRATVVSFQTVPPTDADAKDAKAKNGKNSKSGGHTQVTVAGVGYERSAGGTELDKRLRDMLANDFHVKTGKDLRGDPKAMMKLWKEAMRVKAILSANVEAITNIESLAFDIDYRSKISRKEFEAACADLKGKFAQPIVEAIAKAGLTLNNITSVILTGGHSRTPMVKAAVEAAVGEGKVATSVNADEAAVLGGAFYGASVSRQFRTKDIKVQDISTYDIQVMYLSEARNMDESGREMRKKINTLVFPRGAKVGTKKTLTFKRKSDMLLRMSYRGVEDKGIPTEILEAEISGVAEAIGNLTERGAVDPVVKVTVVLSESGFTGIQDAIAYGEVKDSSFTGKIKEFFNGNGEHSESGNQPAEDAKVGDASAVESSATAENSAPTSTTSTSSSASASPSADKKAKDKGKDKDEKEDLSTIPLKLEVKPLSIPALTPMEIKKARERLVAIDAKEASKRRREEARNLLEAYLYRMRDLLEDDGQTPFKQCSKAEERQAITEKLEETMSWLHNEGDDADTMHFWDKRNAIERLERPIQFRYTEIEAFPRVLNDSQKVNFLTKMFLLEARQNLTAEAEAGVSSRYTSDELDTLEAKLKEHETWLAEWTGKQRNVKQNEDPVILTTEMKARAKTLEKEALKLSRRKVPKVKKTSSTTTTTTEGQQTTLDASATETTNVPPPKATGDGHDEL